MVKSAIRCDDPVIFLEHKRLFKIRGEVPDGEYTIPLGVADVKRAGGDVTVVAISYMVHEALKAAGILERDGIRACVIDPRTLAPLDHDPIVESVKQTGKLVVVDEAAEVFGAAAEIAARVQALAFDFLDAPIQRVCLPNVPIPFARGLEEAVMPNAERIVASVRALC
jgi:pyruvate dehydrogenase E1 component beta subunit